MTTELISKNETSQDLAAQLKAAGSKLTDDRISAILDDTDKTRCSFQVKSLLTGIALLAKKEQLGNRKFKPWYEKLSGQRASRIGDKSYSTAKTYMACSRRFLQKLESGGFAEEFAALKIGSFNASNLLSITTARGDTPALLETHLGRFIGNRSLRQMLADFSAAAQDAAAEIAKELAEGSGGSTTKNQTPTDQTAQNAGSAGEQIDFFGSLDRDLIEADKPLRALVTNPYFLREDIDAATKAKGIEAIRAHIKKIDTELKDKLTALKKGTA